MSRLVVLVLTLALAACGDDHDPNSCKPDGTATIEGMVKREPIGPFVRARQVATGEPAGAPQFAIVLDEVAGACGENATAGKHLVFLFCEQPRALTYEIAPEQLFHCPTNDVLALVERDGGTDFAASTSGSLTIEHAGGCLDGAYEANFSVDQVTGEFDAVVCP